MTQIYSENIRKIFRNKKILEKELNIKLSRKENVLFIEAKPEDEFLALQVIEAIELGFQLSKALLLKDLKYAFEKIYIKDVTKRNDLNRVRARIIGTHGRALKTMESLTDCFLAIHDNTIGIIGLQENIIMTKNAVIKIIKGSKHSNVYAYLEKQDASDLI